MIQYLDELKDILDRYSLSYDDVIIVGSSTLTFYGGRINNDMDFTICKSAYKKISLKVRLRLLFVDHFDCSENVDLFRGRYLCIGVTDKQLFMEDKVNTYEGIKVLRPEYEYAYKMKKKRKKDILDIQYIQNNEQLRVCFDWNMVQKLEHRNLKRVLYGGLLLLKKCIWKVWCMLLTAKEM